MTFKTRPRCLALGCVASSLAAPALAAPPVQGPAAPPLTEPSRTRMRARDWVQFLEFAYGESAEYAPGNGWNYSETNFLLLETIAERLSGQASTALMDSLVISALELRSTFYGPSEALPRGLVTASSSRTIPFMAAFSATPARRQASRRTSITSKVAA